MRKLLLGIVICLCLSVVANAHPGRTDSSGGHTDHDTGEYHFHHGYSAHQHTDMDGDGSLDCPFDFVDKTNSSSDNAKSSGSSNTDEFWAMVEKEREEQLNTLLQADPPKPTVQAEKTRSVVGYILIVGVAWIAISFVIGFVQLIVVKIKRKSKK